MSKADYGRVELELDETIVLRPTLKAMQQIDRRFGSIRQAIEQVGGLSLDALVFVVQAGAGLAQRDAKDLPDRVFEAGIVNVAGPVSEYLAMLLNPSGKSANDTDGEKSGNG